MSTKRVVGHYNPPHVHAMRNIYESNFNIRYRGQNSHFRFNVKIHLKWSNQVNLNLFAV